MGELHDAAGGSRDFGTPMSLGQLSIGSVRWEVGLSWTIVAFLGVRRCRPVCVIEGAVGVRDVMT